MMHRTLTLLPLLAVLTSGCAALESASSSPLSPTGTTGIQIPSLVGTWTSNTLTTVGSSCTDFQWRVTAQSGNSLSGEFSATCAGGISAWGNITGTLVGQEVPYTVSGIATIANGIACPVTLTGTARLDGDAIRIPYDGTTCLGPLRGEEVLRRPVAPTPPPAPAPAPPPPPAPEPPAPPPSAGSPYHVGPGALSTDRAREVVFATGKEFPHLLSPKNSEEESRAGSREMLLRMIWHLQHAGFQAGRQKNPSGAISDDKLTVFCDGQWRGFDVFYDLGGIGKTTQVIWWDLGGANPVPDGGIPD